MNATLASTLVLGFALGMRHATDPDHLAAVSTIVSRERSVVAAGAVGAAWGVGHTLTIFTLGGCILLFSIVVPPRVGLAAEMAVAAMLVGLGALNLFGRHDGGGAHAAWHDLGVPHAHGPARHGPSGVRAALSRIGPRRALRSLAVGVVHGLAGSAAVALLVLSTVRDALWGLAYLAVFGVGTIAGMALLTATFSLPLALSAAHNPRWQAPAVRLTGALSLLFGLYLAWQIGYVDGLFTGRPTWVPG